MKDIKSSKDIIKDSKKMREAAEDIYDKMDNLQDTVTDAVVLTTLLLSGLRSKIITHVFDGKDPFDDSPVVSRTAKI